MLRFNAVICAGLLAAPALFSQAATRAQVESGIQTERQRQLNSLSEPGSSGHKAESATVPWKSLSSEEGDDPTLDAGVAQPHEAPREARKAASKAEHLSKKGHHEEAAAEFRRALGIDPKFYEAENNLALELQAMGKTDEAEKTLRHLMDTAPEHVLAFTNLATMLCEEHRYAEAEAVARQALKAHRFSFKSSYLLGAALVDQGKWTDEAKIKLEYAQVKYPEAKALLSRWPAASSASN